MVANVRDALERGFQGDMIARMAVTRGNDIYTSVRHLLDLGIFDHVHWQLDAIWGEPWEDFPGWVRESYNPGITRLLEDWTEAMAGGRVEGIVPFKAVMTTILKGERASLRCGAGLDAFAITPRGEITVCPIGPEFRDLYIGSIKDRTPEDIRDIMRVGEPCTSCDIFHLCGGRCLFANRHPLWGEEGQRWVCDTVRHMITGLLAVEGTVRDLLEDAVISAGDIFYPETNNGCEIIP